MPILYIGGYGRSGSTVLDQTIAVHLGGISLGEAVYLPRSVSRHDRCSCGVQADLCPVWHDAASQIRLQSPALRDHSFREDGLWGLMSPRSPHYDRAQRAIFQKLESTLYCDSSKTCRHAMLRPWALDQLFPGQLFFVWLHRPLLDTITQSLMKGTNQQLEHGSTSGLPWLRIARGVIGYIYANVTAWVYAAIVFRHRSILIDQRQLRQQPDLVLHRIADLVHQAGRSSVASAAPFPMSPPRFEPSLDPLHQIAGNRNRRQF